jgi:hypothetical protein
LLTALQANKEHPATKVEFICIAPQDVPPVADCQECDHNNNQSN